MNKEQRIEQLAIQERMVGTSFFNQYLTDKYIPIFNPPNGTEHFDGILSGISTQCLFELKVRSKDYGSYYLEKYKYDNLMISADSFNAIYYITITPERVIIFDLKKLNLSSRWFIEPQVRSSHTAEKRNKELANLTIGDMKREYNDFTGYTFNNSLIVN